MDEERFDQLYNRILDGDNWDYSTLDELICLSESGAREEGRKDMKQKAIEAFNVIAATFYEHYDDILNFYNKRSSNAAAESFNAKIKQFRTALRGVVDEKFFLFRLAKIYAYPQ